MNWDWDKLQGRRRPSGGGGGGDGPHMPDFDEIGAKLKQFKGINFPVGKLAVLLVVILWLLSGIYIVDPDEAGVVLRFGAYDRTTQPGPHYHLPYPIESVITPKVSQIRRAEVGLRSIEREGRSSDPNQFRIVPEESLMLTGDENIVDIQFIVQYQIKDPVDYLFKVSEQAKTVKDAAEAAMREVVGYNKIDSVLTTDKLQVQNQTRLLMQEILDRYELGIRVVAVQLQDVQPPKEVVDAFKDVASAREDRVRIINEAEAYSNDLIPRTRGLGAQLINEAEAYKETVIRKSEGEASRFLAVLKEYNLARDVTKQRLYLEAMETIFSNPDMEKVIMSDKALNKAVPYLPLDRLAPSSSGSSGARGNTK